MLPPPDLQREKVEVTFSLLKQPTKQVYKDANTHRGKQRLACFLYSLRRTHSNATRIQGSASALYEEGLWSFTSFEFQFNHSGAV